MFFSLSVKAFHVHTYKDSEHFGAIKHCTICQYTVVTTLDNAPLSIEKPFLEIYHSEEPILIVSLPKVTTFSTKQLRAPPIS